MRFYRLRTMQVGERRVIRNPRKHMCTYVHERGRAWGYRFKTRTVTTGIRVERVA